MKVHFIAIGGSAMHNLALALHQKGYELSGSDDVIYEPSKSRLESKGLLPQEFGWFPEKITQDIDAILLGMHAKEDNPELLRAQELGIPIYSYPEFLYDQSKDKTRVVIGGSHGKTTITSMILHVMQYHDIAVDYMVGAQLEGFDTMVHLTKENQFIVLEGDEYLSSPIDRRPKFHLYKPNIALLSGIAWDHINVFPTFENYLSQFEIFLDKITDGGSITYNATDIELKRIVEKCEKPIRKFPYGIPAHSIENGITYLETEDGPMPLEIFGAHNLNNIVGAKWICQQMGVDEVDFYEAIASFKGASKRLEKFAKNAHSIGFKDFAHSPSKVIATTRSVRQQYPNKQFIACVELHTYSSLNPQFIQQYQGALDQCDTAVVFYSPKALAIKNMAPISPEDIQKAFGKEDLIVFTEPQQMHTFIKELSIENSILLLMSSGNYGGLNLEEVKKKF
ncbi:MAG: Mur ligase family protein [Flavobacteriaceae bacterium]|nr:Mur ligase family protein [Flavobacteriaceae bacterium]